LLTGSGYVFKGTSDTEIAVCAIQCWGLEEALKKFVGMFAFALWDRQSRELYLARDRLGEKPLYYGNIKNGFVFASELKSITTHPDWNGVINRNALAYQVKYTYIPSPHCIYAGLSKLEPGCYLEISTAGGNINVRSRSYWSAGMIVEQAVTKNRGGYDKVALVDELDTLLLGTIEDKMIADVPVGAFLSGGIDSSLVVAHMQKLSSRPVKTFTIGFNEPEYNEATYAKDVARHIGTEHTELYVTPEETRAVIPRIPQIYDEPFSDSSQIPTFIISELASQDVTVALSGDGGDELFGGYTRYFIGMDLWNKISKIPGPVRSLAGKMINRVPDYRIDQMMKPVLPFLPEHLRHKQFGNKLHKLANIWNTSSEDSIYEGLISLWPDSDQVVIGAGPVDIKSGVESVTSHIDHFSEQMMYTDMVSYLPDDILVKVDRASMAVSLEVRVPFLDHRVVEFIWNQSPDLKITGNIGKWLLREVLHKYVPRELIDRPKMGFGVPLDHWLRGPLRDWAEDLISHERLTREGYLNPFPIRKRWEEHLSGNVSWQYQLWPIIMFQAWHEHWMT